MAVVRRGDWGEQGYSSVEAEEQRSPLQQVEYGVWDVLMPHWQLLAVAGRTGKAQSWQSCSVWPLGRGEAISRILVLSPGLPACQPAQCPHPPQHQVALALAQALALG